MGIKVPWLGRYGQPLPSELRVLAISKPGFLSMKSNDV